MTIQRILRCLEFILLFFGFPILLVYSKNFMLPSTILFPVLLFILIVLHKSKDFRWKELLKWEIDRRTLLKTTITIGLIAILLFVYVLVFIPDQLFNLPKNNWKIWIAISIFYPVFSVFAQEIVFRIFIFKRYSLIFNKPTYFIIASGISFSFAHIFYFHAFSMVSTLLLGLYLGSVYVKTKSVLFTSLIHAILGDLVFAVGLGQYFWLEMANHF